MSRVGFRSRGRASLFWVLLNRQRRWLKWLLVLFVANAVANVRVSDLVRKMVDQGIVDQSRPLDAFAPRIAVQGLFALVLTFATSQVTRRINYTIEFDIRVWLYTRVQSARLARLDKVPTGQLVTRSLTDVAQLERILEVVPFVIGMMPVILALELVLLRTSWKMALIAPLALPINLWFVHRFRGKLASLSLAELNERAQVAGAIDEPVRGIRVIKSFGRVEEARTRVAAVALTVYRLAMSRARLLAKYDMVMKTVPHLVQAAVVAVGARLLAADDITLGSFLIAFSLVSLISGFATTFDEVASSWQYLRSAQARLSEMLGLGTPPSTVGQPLPEPSTGLELRGVRLERGRRVVVDGLDLRVAAGEMVVVQGPPGSGKSTLAALAVGVVSPDAGTAFLDGVDLHDLSSAALCAAVRVVSEESMLFAASLRENLRIGATAPVGDEAMAGALWAAAADDIVDHLPNGLDSHIGDRGLTLSGGQRQRLALARALVTPPRVLVLDDALGAVTPALELDILLRIRAHAPQTSVVCIARRNGPRSLADSVVELPAPAPAGDMAASNDAVADQAAAVAARATGETPAAMDRADHDEMPTARGLARPFRWLVVAGLLALLVQSLTQLSPQYLFGRISDVVEGRDLAQADRRVLAMMALAVVYAASSYAFRVLVQKFMQGVVYHLRRHVFHRLTRLGIDFYDREQPGEIAARVINDLDTILSFLEKSAFRVLTAGAQFLAAITAISILSPNVVPVALGIAAAVVGVSAVQLPIGLRAAGWAREELGRVIAKFEEDFHARGEIRNLGASSHQTQKFIDASWRRRRARWWSATVMNSYAAVVQYLGLLASALILWRAGVNVLDGSISIGTALTLQLLATTAIQPLQTVGLALTDFLNARVSWNRVKEPFEAPVLPAPTPDARPCPVLRDEVRFEKVGFAYPHTQRAVLHSVSFTLAPGAVTALVGYTGAGKSSIAKLLQRTYDPTAGAVHVDGIDIRELRLDEYRSRIGVAPQDPFLFKGTVASNIAHGRPSAPPEEIRQAVLDVGADDLLRSLGDDLDQPVDEEGRNLTAAQRQLIALSRAWLVRPDILVLDEATSCLDDNVEARVLDAVRHLGVTTLMVTHRESVAKRADVVIVLDDGRVAEIGTPAELVGAGGAYDRLWAVDDKLAGLGAAPLSTGLASRRPRTSTAQGAR